MIFVENVSINALQADGLNKNSYSEMRGSINIYCAIFCSFISIFLISCKSRHKLQQEMLLMGTRVEIIALGNNRAALQKAVSHAFQEIKRIERIMSEWDDGSEVSAINRNAGLRPVKISGELIDILNKSIQISKATNGAFDITWLPLKDLWNMDEKLSRLPSDAEIKHIINIIGYEYLKLNNRESTAYLNKAQMKIGLGAIAKGYAVDKSATVMKKAGINNFLINAGGDIYASGLNENAPWEVGIKAPNSNNDIITSININNEAIATSGVYEKYIIINDRKYSHIINPRTGHPSASDIKSISVIAGTCTLADAWATALLVMGTEKALAMVDSRSEIEAFIIDDKGNHHISTGINGRLNDKISTNILLAK